MGESNLERNALAVFDVCNDLGKDKETCADLAHTYITNKAEVIREHFKKMAEVARKNEKMVKAERFELRSKGIDDAESRAHAIINSFEAEE